MLVVAKLRLPSFSSGVKRFLVRETRPARLPARALHEITDIKNPVLL